MNALDPHGLEALTRYLDFAAGQFDLAMVRADAPADRAALEAWLRERVAALEVFELDALGSNPFACLHERHARGDALLVTGFEGRTDEAFRALNVQRDSLIEVAPIPWILLGHHRALSDLRQVAPDFCDMVSVHATVAAGSEEPVLPYSAIVRIDHQLSPVRKLIDEEQEPLVGRAIELHRQGRLSDARKLLDRWWIDTRRDPSADPRVVARGLAALGSLMDSQGDLDGARRMLEQAGELLPDSECEEVASEGARAHPRVDAIG
jgi:tetratricopeptide (TPR) repeat protein